MRLPQNLILILIIVEFALGFLFLLYGLKIRKIVVTIIGVIIGILLGGLIAMHTGNAGGVIGGIQGLLKIIIGGVVVGSLAWNFHKIFISIIPGLAVGSFFLAVSLLAGFKMALSKGDDPSGLAILFLIALPIAGFALGFYLFWKFDDYATIFSFSYLGSILISFAYHTRSILELYKKDFAIIIPFTVLGVLYQKRFEIQKRYLEEWHLKFKNLFFVLGILMIIVTILENNILKGGVIVNNSHLIDRFIVGFSLYDFPYIILALYAFQKYFIYNNVIDKIQRRYLFLNPFLFLYLIYFVFFSIIIPVFVGILIPYWQLFFLSVQNSFLLFMIKSILVFGLPLLVIKILYSVNYISDSSYNVGNYHDIKNWSEPIIDKDVKDADFYDINSGKPKPKIDQAEIDRILDKISQSGYQNLTEEEKRILFKSSKYE